jgi:hypothetical protein
LNTTKDGIWVFFFYIHVMKVVDRLLSFFFIFMLLFILAFSVNKY